MRVPLAVTSRPVYRLYMRISDVIRRKGDMVVTIRPTESVEQLLAMLEEHRIGAVVVSEDGETVAGSAMSCGTCTATVQPCSWPPSPRS